MMSDALVLKSIAPDIYFSAERDALFLRRKKNNLVSADLCDAETWQHLIDKSDYWHVLPIAVGQMIEMELAACSDGDICFQYRNLVQAEHEGFTFFQKLASPSPFFVSIESSGSIGTENFRYFYKFLLGLKEVPLEVRGCFARYREEVYKFDPRTFALIDEINRFNASASSDRKKVQALISFKQIKELSSGVGAQLDQFLLANKVIIPSKTLIDFVDSNDELTMVPRFPEVSDTEMEHAFLRIGDVQDVYDLTDRDGNRVRVVLDEEQQETLKRMQRVRRLNGAERKKMLSNPNTIFEGIDQDRIDLSKYSQRVKGIGNFVFTPVPHGVYTRSGMLEDMSEPKQPRKFNAVIALPIPGGESEEIVFNSAREVCEVSRTIDEALANDETEIKIKGKAVLLTDELKVFVRDVEKRLSPGKKDTNRDEKGKSDGQFLLIYTNCDSLEYTEMESEISELPPAEFPQCIAKRDIIKPHQEIGIAWQQRRFSSMASAGGALLADDMGLGKTVQVLIFLAWCIEKGHIKRGVGDLEHPPWNPILVVMPKMLLDSRCWITEARNFFDREGNVFEPILEAYGDTLKQLRREKSGTEVELGLSLLDVNEFYNWRVVLTNYETVQNYQHSFAQVDWSIIVTDEAQKYKTPNTKISHALKALKARFRIAVTGTPVENRLLDIWNISDFLQPGSLGSAKEFSQRFEEPIIKGEKINDVLDDLRETIRYRHPDALVLRREKQDHLVDFPEKHEVVIESEVTEEQWKMEREILSRAKVQGGQSSAFQALDGLSKLYQHPHLLDPDGAAFPTTKELLQRSPKLLSVIKALEVISSKGEKAIVFSRSIDMQAILKVVLDDYFRLKIEIINGDSGVQPRIGISNERQRILREFSEKSGYNVIILSPHIAGIGLNITAANHVFHYGRWWNPAVEMQATDRAYRLGQSKPVYVYLPVSVFKEGQQKSFDQRLHELLSRKYLLAKDFLQPMPGDVAIASELEADLLAGSGDLQEKTLSDQDVLRMRPNEFEALFGAIFRQKGYQVILTPVNNDGGVDVIAVNDAEVLLIQCKHTVTRSLNAELAVNELEGALDYYRAKSGLQRKNWKCLVACNAAIGGRISSQFMVIDGSNCRDLIRELQISWRHVDAVEKDRVSCRPEVLERLSTLAV